MKQLKSSHSKTFHYDNVEERLNHIKEMEQDGWTCCGQVKEFTGNLWFKDEVEDESKYYCVGEFYKEERNV